MTTAGKVILGLFLGIVGVIGLGVSLCSGYVLIASLLSSDVRDGVAPISLIFLIPAALITVGTVIGLIRLVRMTSDKRKGS